MKRLGPAVKAVVLSPGAEPEDGDALIPSIGLGEGRGPMAISPAAGAILLAHLLAPLRTFGLVGATATLLEPASTRGEPALHELFEQTKALLTFSAQPEPKVLGSQWAFNLGAASADDDANLRRQLRQLLATRSDDDLDLSVNTLHAGVFHGMSASLTLEFDAPVEVESLRDAWQADAAIELADEPERLGPVDAAQSEKLLVGDVRVDPNHPRRAWVWATMDNLTRGGAINAIEIAESLLAS
jgi:aspartate-semialdehyde dehydrogenase